MLIRHHAVRKDKHEKAGPKATYQGWRTKSGHSNNVPLLFDAGFFLVSADSANVAMCFQEKCCLVPFLQSTDTTEHRMQQRQQNKNKGFQY
jgi:hypothetical protein